MRPALLLLALALAPACTRPLDEPITPVDNGKDARTPPAPANASAAPAPSTELDPRFVPVIAAAYRDYKAWGRVDDELRWAPWLCRMPEPGRARMSGAEDGDHARKLYSVFVKEQKTYPLTQAAAPEPQPVGQILVKESYYPELVDKANPPEDLAHLQEKTMKEDHFNPYARVGDRVYRASRLAGAYVVLKVAPGTPGTDAGWVYGTVTPAGEVTSAGRVASCMGCHVSARYERVFGLDPAKNGND
ncbi:hypothetical protein [Polyangium jinanense]|uniref:Cytochrome P460 domain-containing protein n=1 Tax=Polyangium jinanense TaxID=2829994 RepID=A0A9X3WZX8_9BACT|nr:hypothetical protein [Polyangium jinanense]MDC3955221.1 hypothetical protein [Polyangium jinanense]MDC3981522.1 hypothetical protein [Polyangium jinanense]